MQQLWPPPPDPDSALLTDPELYDVYSYPDAPDAPYVKVNFVSSVNGVPTVDGRSRGLSFKADHRVFALLRELSDVILVGAGTVRAERYRGARSSELLRASRVARGLSEVPPIAVVTASADLDPRSPLFTDTRVPPLVCTVEAAPTQRVARLAEAGAEVMVVGEQRAEITLMLDALARRGLHRVLCEGGPRLFGTLIAADAVDELCLTLSPCLVGGTDRISVSPPTGVQAMRLASALTAEGGLLLRYRRDR